MAKTKKVHQEENDDSGAAVVLLVIGATAGLWAWLRLRKPAPAVSFPFVARGQATSQVVHTSKSWFRDSDQRRQFPCAF